MEPKANKDIDIIASFMILLDRFVDDLPSGSDLKEVIERLRGEILDNWQTTGTLAAIFTKGGFILKVVGCSGDKDGPMVQKLGGAVYGIKWSTETDKFTIPLTVNISNRHRGGPTGPDVTKATVGILEEATLTRRINLSLTMLLYDPLGFIMPLTIRLKWHSSSWLNRRASQSEDHANQKMWTDLRKPSSSVIWMVAIQQRPLWPISDIYSEQDKHMWHCFVQRANSILLGVRLHQDQRWMAIPWLLEESGQSHRLCKR